MHTHPQHSRRTLSLNFKLNRWIVCGLTALLGLTTDSNEAKGQGQTELIAQTGQAVPVGAGTFNTFLSDPGLNDAGQVVFSSLLSGGLTSQNRGAYLRTGGSITQLIRLGQADPGGLGTITAIGSPDINQAGQAFFSLNISPSGGGGSLIANYRWDNGISTQIFLSGQPAPDGNGTYSTVPERRFNNSGQLAMISNLSGTSGGTADDSGVFISNNGSISQIVREGQAVPDANGSFGSFAGLSFNDFGQVAFRSGLIGTSGGNADSQALFRSDGSALTQIVRRGQSAPGGNGTFSSLGVTTLNRSGQVAFHSTLIGTSGGSSDNRGIFRGAGGAITPIVRAGQAAPDANGVFSSFETQRYSLNDAGQVAFLANLSGTLGGNTDSGGVFRGSGGAITQIARTGQTAPLGNGSFSEITYQGMNQSGQVAFQAFLDGTSGGTNDNYGVFIGDGVDLLKVIRKGDALGGSTVSELPINFSMGESLNEHGQFAYRAQLANNTEAVGLWTPDLRWRYNSSSTWESSGRWTLGLKPAAVHHVVIDPSASLTVHGPTNDTSVRSLQIGGGSGLATLNLQSGSVLTAVEGVSIQSTGTLTGDGTIAGNVLNQGIVAANNLTIHGNLTNQRIIQGNGRVHANLINSANGEIRVNSNNAIWFSGPSFSNAGLVEVHGGELRVSSAALNSSGTSLISVRNGSVIAESGLTNQGSIAMTLGASTLRGDINNTGIIQVSGGSHATFLDDVVQNGVMQVSRVGGTSSTAVLLGEFSGSGGFVGGGDVFALGDLRPGNSPASVLYDGNLFLGTTTNTHIELGGLNHGQFDQLVVTGDLNLNGDLFVSLIDGHILGASQQYLIADVSGILTGQFAGLQEGQVLGNFGGYDLMITYAAGGGNGVALFTAIPEPTTGLLTLSLLFSLALKRRREIRS